MRCPFCLESGNGVVDSRETDDGRAIRRRRSCPKCTRRFTTYERIEEMPIFVVKKDRQRQTFDRLKLVAGMERACEKRPVPVADIESAAADIERRAYELGAREIAAQWFGEEVMAALRKMDEVAYIRFATTIFGVHQLTNAQRCQLAAPLQY